MEQETGAELQGDGYYLPDGELLWHCEDQWLEPHDCLKMLQARLVYVERNPNFWNDEDSKFNS